MGVTSSFISAALMNYIYYANARIKVEYTFNVGIWIATVIFGFLSPIATNFLTIRKSLTNNLKDSLDLYRRSVN